jgi:SRSO17 transposase
MRCGARPAHGAARRSAARPKEWPLIEWLDGEAQATKFRLSTLPPDTPIDRLVYLAKLRWLIERDYLELKQEICLGHYEGRSWRGLHHYAAWCIAAYGFLVAEHVAIPTSVVGACRLVQALSLPDGYQPRDAAAQNRT